jgi:hypothetical protein
MKLLYSLILMCGCILTLLSLFTHDLDAIKYAVLGTTFITIAIYFKSNYEN